MTSRLIPEQVVPGKRLGRHVGQDPRSLRYLVRPRAHAAVTVDWQRQIPVLDQGDLGSCTGNATIGVLGSTPFYATLDKDQRELFLNEEGAVGIYSAATRLDDAPGQYKPDDTGSDGLSAAKAAHNAGLISGYLHCTSVDATITALQDGPVICGANWYEGFDEAGSTGLVTITGSVRGGHEFELLGVDLEAKLIHAVNSWGTGYGKAGHFYFTLTDLERLLREQGDVTAFVPLTKPAPVPTPAPTPDPSGLAVTFTSDEAASLHNFSGRPHIWRVATAAAKVLKAHGL